MARLNDPPVPPTESIEALKRRFIRQNREIARVNSTQSQRIRNLETEISRLLADNIALREQAIAAQAEADRWRRANIVSQEILHIKDRMQKKMDEMNVLIAEMGELPAQAARRARRKSRMDTVESLSEQEWKLRQSAKFTLAAERGDVLESRLPMIREDKQYPRRTMDDAELATLREHESALQASASPELGPPPVAHLEDSDPIVVEPRDVSTLPTTLEKRKKRRTSALLRDMPADDAAAMPSPRKPSSQLLKSGAKRKLDICDVDEPPRPPAGELDDFVFQRMQPAWTSATVSRRASRFSKAPGRENEIMPVESKEPSPRKTVDAARRILAPKSTNSPTKPRLTGAAKPQPELNGGPQHEHDSQHIKHAPPKATSALNTTLQHDMSQATAQEKGQWEASNGPPKTPAALADGILSPTSTEPSVRTLPQIQEATLLNSVEDVLNGGVGRGSRRRRPTVSYAEPNLRDKMRRPGKELVGAVEGIEKSTNVRGDDNEGESSRRKTADSALSETVKAVETFNLEPEALSGRHHDQLTELAAPRRKPKQDPSSPLLDKETRGRKYDGDEVKSKATRDLGPQADTKEVEEGVDRLSIFDPPVSSPIDEPPNPSTHEAAARALASSMVKRQASGNSGGRRHSMQHSASTLQTTAGKSSGLCGASSSAETETTSQLARHVSRSVSVADAGHHQAHASAGRSLTRSKSVASNLMAARLERTAVVAAATGDQTLRAERSANRRRSMMI